MDIVFNNRDDTLKRIATLYASGQPPRIICPVCRAEIVVRYAAKEVGAELGAGIAALYCPTDRAHVFVFGKPDPDVFWAEHRKIVDALRRGQESGEKSDPGSN